MKVTVQGKLHWSQWQDKQSGQNRSKVDITADHIELPPGNRQQPAQQAQPTQQASYYDEDIPF